LGELPPQWPVRTELQGGGRASLSSALVRTCVSAVFPCVCLRFRPPLLVAWPAVRRRQAPKRQRSAAQRERGEREGEEGGRRRGRLTEARLTTMLREGENSACRWHCPSLLRSLRIVAAALRGA
jgi:hypothetical protein